MSLLLWLSCQGGGHPPPAEEVQGMVPVPAGSVTLGPRWLEPVEGAMSFLEARDADPVPSAEGGPQGGPGHPPPPGGPGQPPQGGPQGAPGQPPPGPPGAPPGGHRPQRQDQDWERWQIRDGMQVEPREVPLQAFWIDRTEVTRAAYKEFLDATGYRPPYIDEEWSEADWNWQGSDYAPGTAEHPVVLVNWYDASAYCAWRGKRLPTEAEWQMAALGPDGGTWPWGEEYAGDRLNHGTVEVEGFDPSDGYRTTSPVGSFPEGRSWVGAEDMFGNAWEWTADGRVESWELAQGDRVLQPTLYMAVRGGSYFTDLRPDPAGERHHFMGEVRRKTSGFRCASSQRPG